MIADFKQTGCPISVNFRELAKSLPHPERATHLIHPYPAKLLAHIPYFFLSSSLLSSSGATVLDPFCGSGTVLLEALLAGRNAVGADANPLARLIATVKIRRLNTKALTLAKDDLLSRIQAEPKTSAPDVVNLDYWFTPHVVSQLIRIREAISLTSDPAFRDFFDVCFSNCVRRVSLASPRLSVPVRLRPERYPPDHPLHSRTAQLLRKLETVDVIREFTSIAEANLRRVATLSDIPVESSANIAGFDARHLDAEPGSETNRGHFIPNDSIDLIITSPPYVSAQKYIRACSLSLGWLGLCGRAGLRTLEDQNIGREHFPQSAYSRHQESGVPEADVILASIRDRSPLRSHIASIYLIEMAHAIKECHRVLKPCHYMVLVAGNSTVAGYAFDTQLYLQRLAESAGFSTELIAIDTIRSRGLMTRRNKTANIITREAVMLLRKDKSQ